VTSAHLTFAGVDFRMTVSGALYAPKADTLIVADLHLEKGSSFARQGRLLPPYDSQSTIAALTEVIERFRPTRVVCLGDSFHDWYARERLMPNVRGALTALARRHDWIWVTGNHDPEPAPCLGGRAVGEFHQCGLVFRHQARKDSEPGEVSGHFHPRASLIVRGRRLSARCFVSDGQRLIVPAFGAYTGGLDVTHPEIAGLMAPDFKTHFLGRAQVHRLSVDQLETTFGARPAGYRL